MKFCSTLPEDNSYSNEKGGSLKRKSVQNQLRAVWILRLAVANTTSRSKGTILCNFNIIATARRTANEMFLSKQKTKHPHVLSQRDISLVEAGVD